MKLPISQEKRPLGGNVSSGLHFKVLEIDPPMPVKSRFLEGMDSPCQTKKKKKQFASCPDKKLEQTTFRARKKMENINYTIID